MKDFIAGTMQNIKLIGIQLIIPKLEQHYIEICNIVFL